MAEFKIINTDDPSLYKDKIIKFWADYLPNTPAERFDWLLYGNRAGKTIWLIALLEKNQEFIGSVSLMPRDIFHNGNIFHGVIMGDLMIHADHRVYGPFMSLLKSAVKYALDNNFDFIYTIPNPSSMNVVGRLGFKQYMEIDTYVKPIKIGKYLEKYMPPFFAGLLSYLPEILSRIITRESCLLSRGSTREVFQADNNFDDLMKRYRENKGKLFGDHSSSYINWRYLNNPVLNFRILAYHVKKESELTGYIVFNQSDDKLSIYDIFPLEEDIVEQLLKALINLARKEKCKAIYFALPSQHKLTTIIKSYRFFNSKDTMKLYWIENNSLNLSKWCFFQGERNV